jgi:hypothetical protein
MGSQKCRIVGKSQPAAMMINPIISTRTLSAPPIHRVAVRAARRPESTKRRQAQHRARTCRSRTRSASRRRRWSCAAASGAAAAAAAAAPPSPAPPGSAPPRRRPCCDGWCSSSATRARCPGARSSAGWGRARHSLSVERAGRFRQSERGRCDRFAHQGRQLGLRLRLLVPQHR